MLQSAAKDCVILIKVAAISFPFFIDFPICSALIFHCLFKSAQDMSYRYATPLLVLFCDGRSSLKEAQPWSSIPYLIAKALNTLFNAAIGYVK